MTLEECLRLYGEALSESERLWLQERVDSPEAFDDIAERLRRLEAERDTIVNTIGEHYEQTVQEGVKEPTQEELGLEARARVEQGLKAAGRFTEPQIDVYMELWDSIGRSWAEHHGRDPVEWYKEYLTDVQPARFEEMIENKEGLLYQMGAEEAKEFLKNRPFYSQLQNVVENKLPGAGSPANFKQMIQSWANKGEFKKEELEYSGILEWLDEQDVQKLTKEQVMTALQSNEIQIQEVFRGAAPGAPAPAIDRAAHARTLAGQLTEDYDLSADYEVAGMPAEIPYFRLEPVGPGAHPPAEVYRVETPVGFYRIERSLPNEAWQLHFEGELLETFSPESVGLALAEAQAHFDNRFEFETELAQDVIPDDPGAALTGDQDLADIQGGARAALPTKFAEYRLKPPEISVGGRDYFEVELIMPTRLQPQMDALRLREVELEAVFNAGDNATPEMLTEAGLPTHFNRTDVAHVLGSVRHELSQLQRQALETTFPGGSPSHWPEENVVGHIRGQTFTDTEGKQVLFIDELQSDWHQTGRKAGYKSTISEQERTTLLAQLEDLDFQRTRLIEENARVMEQLEDERGLERGALMDPPPENLERARQAQAIEPQIDALRTQISRGTEGAVPDAPFKQTWPLLLFKHVMKYAVDNGYDKIAWTPGIMQIERYKTALRQRVDKIIWKKLTPDSAYLIEGKPTVHIEAVKDGEIVFAHQVPLDGATDIQGHTVTLDDLVGDKQAAHIRASELVPGSGSFEAADLAIGGQGMKAFYDRIVPNLVKKYVKKYGGTVGSTVLQEALTHGLEIQERGGEYEVIDTDQQGVVRGAFGSPEDAQNFIGELVESQAFKQLGKSAVEAWSVDITPEMTKAVQEEGQPLFQKGKRGAVEFLGEHGPAIMYSFEAADATTPIHETGHILLEMLRERQDADWNTVTDWLEADPTAPLNTKQKEQFAKGFEAYVMEGKSPSFKMREVFARLREWMLRIYRGIRGLNVKINDKVRDVFDRLVAREAERMKDPIDDAAEWMNVQDTQEPIELGPDPQYESLQAEARRRATLKVKKLKEKRDRKVAADFKKEAKESIAEIPIYSAMDELVKLGGLNHEAVLRDWGQENVTALMRKRPGIIAKKGTVYPDIFAADEGFESDDAMIMAMLDAPTKAEAVDKYMLELYDQYEEYIEADDADLYLRTIDEEIKILRDLTKRFKPTTARGIKGVIRAETGQIKMSSLVSEHEALKGAMEKTARAARDAYRAGRKEATLELKESQRTLAIQRREVARAKKEATAIRERLKKLLKLSTKDKKVELEYRERLHDFLSEFDLVAMTDRSRRRLESRQEWLNRKEAEGEEAITDILRASIDRLNKIPWTELTLPELKEIEAAAQMIAQLGRKKNELMGRKKAREVETSVQRVLDSIDKHWKDVRGPLQDPLADGTLIRGLKLWHQYDAELKAAEFILRRLDGFEDMGPIWDEIFLPIKEAQDFEDTLGPQVQEAIQKAFAPLADKRSATKRWLTETYRIEGLDQPFAKVGSKSPMTKDRMISAALNVGTEGNRQALVEGYGWSEENLANILDHLTKEEWQLVRDIWDTFDITWPLLAEQYRKLTGARLPKVDGILVQTKFGVIQGKYYPLVPHRKLSRRMDRLATEAEYRDFFRHVYTVPAARTGSVFERTGTKLPPELAIGVAFRKHVENIHYLTHVLAVRDVNKILSDPRVEQKIIETQGEAIYRQLKPWLQEVARPRREPMTAVEATLDFLRRNTTVVALGIKVSVGMKQALSLTQSMNELGALPVLTSVSSFWSNPITMKAKMEWVNQRSPQMSQRRHRWDRELADAYRRFDLSLVSGSKGARDAWFSLIGFVDAMAVYPAWMAAYTEGLKKYAWEWEEAKPGTVTRRTFDSLEQKAVEFADAHIRKTQPVASPKDLAEIQRGGPGRRILTMFYTFFSRMQNVWMESKGKYRLGKLTAAQFARATWYIWIMPVMLAMTGAAVREKRVPELSEVAKNLMLYKIGGLPYVRDFVSPWFSGYEYTMSPVAGAGKSFAKLVGETTGKRREKLLLKYAIEGGGYVFGYPGRQFSITTLGMIDLIEGQTDDPLRLFFTEPYQRR